MTYDVTLGVTIPIWIASFTASRVMAVPGMATEGKTGYTFENCTQFCVDGVHRLGTGVSESPGFCGKRGPYAGDPKGFWALRNRGLQVRILSGVLRFLASARRYQAKQLGATRHTNPDELRIVTSQ